MHIDFVPDRSLYPFESRWFDSTAGRVHYLDEGTGPPILFCHGNPTWSFLYRHVVRRLSDRFRCIAVDYPGFGLSDRPAGYGYTAAEHVAVVGELVDHLQLDTLVVMGQDWGGPIGTGVAVERADRIRGLVLGNTWFWPSDAPSFRAFSTLLSSGVMQRRILHRNFFVERILPLGMATRLSRPEMDHYRGVQPDAAARVGVAEFPRQILAARPLLQQLEHQVPDRLGDKPALLTWGMRDPAFRPGALLGRMRGALGNHTVVELSRARHFIQEDSPGEIADAIAARFG